MIGCPKLASLDLGNLAALQRLECSRCNELESITGTNSLTALKVSRWCLQREYVQLLFTAKREPFGAQLGIHTLRLPLCMYNSEEGCGWLAEIVTNSCRCWSCTTAASGHPWTWATWQRWSA